jgi:hypothetical protein
MIFLKVLLLKNALCGDFELLNGIIKLENNNGRGIRLLNWARNIHHYHSGGGFYRAGHHIGWRGRCQSNLQKYNMMIFLKVLLLKNALCGDFELLNGIIKLGSNNGRGLRLLNRARNIVNYYFFFSEILYKRTYLV